MNQGISRSLFTSAKQTWETPDALFAELNDEFAFTVDVCAESATAKLPRHWSPAESAWWQPWAGETCWMNPPYSEVSKWMSKAVEASEAGATVVALVPSRTDTRWWHDYAMKADEIRFLRGRLKFGDAVNSAPFPSVVLVFREKAITDGKEIK